MDMGAPVAGPKTDITFLGYEGNVDVINFLFSSPFSNNFISFWCDLETGDRINHQLSAISSPHEINSRISLSSRFNDAVVSATLPLFITTTSFLIDC